MTPNKTVPEWPDEQPRLAIVAWWTEVERCGDSGATTWEVLDRVRDRVTECLAVGDIEGASLYTAKAMLLMDGADV